MSRTAIYQVGVLTIGPSGSVTINPLLSDQAYMNVCIDCTPLGAGPDYRYQADVYLNGMLKETEDNTDAGVLKTTQLVFKDQLFPPNIGLNTRADMSGAAPAGVTGFSLTITNYENARRDFAISVTFEAFQTVCKRLNFSQ